MWKFLDDGSDQGLAWRSAQFNDSHWTSGLAPLGYGQKDVTTTLAYGPDSNHKHITSYFRTSFIANHFTSYKLLMLRVRRDDGAVVYLNSTEVFRTNMPEGNFTYLTVAPQVVSGDNESKFYQANVDPRSLIEGVNVLAVEVHQANAASSDIILDLELTGSTVLPTPRPTNTPVSTATPMAGDPVLLAAGDIADCAIADGASETAKLLDALPGTILTLGDNAYENGTESDFAECYDPTWGHFRGRTFPAPGNHDYQTLNASGYFQYFGAVAGDPKRGYYSFDLGMWHIVALNSICKAVSGCDTGSPQYNWLTADLAAHPSKCTLAFMHYPLFSSGDHGGVSTMTPLWNIMYQAGVDVVLAGHDHDYERFAPQDPNGKTDLTKGLRLFVVGTGGGGRSAIRQALANSAVRNDTTYGILKMALHPQSYDWQFVPVEGGKFTDSGTGICH